MTVRFVGAGPGAPDLITVRGLRALATSPVCLYAGSLVPPELLAQCPPGVHLVDTARLTLDEITTELLAAHEAGHDVARLCSGDPAVFSAVAEQTRRLDAADVPWEIVPGVPAFAAAAAALRTELTVPGVGQSVVLTRDAANATPMPAGESLDVWAAAGGTLVLHLAVQRCAEVVAALRAHRPASEPVAVVARASRDDEVVLRGTLADIAGRVAEADVRRTAVIVVGPVVGTSEGCDSHLYSAARARP
ncbi:precorrin-4 C(11)-methyltransferase [Actinomycetospora cinnamomea]|uniref:Precorrin-4/cobalt-precorrin-4 C11-methyltransferase n=1 Tax=Actinomycetospora cinnamomea TaxID=663609 RepID=A0A2U1E8A6_9PSEU|nr:precorrin-4 C(11)-methyltransferase [Actinomycetospora cinnamomea]PVY96176.1 precorrin-4/cobalt-precorrin-4 C11-methyltransferase [Actinomycetospora cinnamomea]